MILAAVLFALPLAVPPARGAVITTNDMARGFSATPAQCASIPQAVWVSAGGRGFCIRYYLSTLGGSGTRPAVFLQGDRPSGKFDRRTGQFIADPAARDVNTQSLVGFAELLSQQTRTTAIYLARIGVDGSSGHQDLRRSVLETIVLNQALDAIKRRHRLEGYHLVGQSGGAANVGGLLALRTDIGCAVVGSAPLALSRDTPRPGTDPLLVPFNPTNRVAAIVRNRPGRILVITDPLDRTVHAENQSVFTRELIRAGRAAEQYYVEALDEKHHGVTPYATYALAACMDGRSQQEVARGLADLVEQRVAAASARPGSDGRSQLAPIPAQMASAPLPTKQITHGRLRHGPGRPAQTLKRGLRHAGDGR